MTLPSRSPSLSLTQMTQYVLPTHANVVGNVFGGQIMAWMDLCAAICAERHAGMVCITAGIDDLSFEESQTDYKEMKTLMDGGLEQMPDNLLFYATSNRKHLIPTRFSDSESDDVRPGDAIEEKVSLADRFGLRLGFSHMDQDTYLEVVDLYASRAGLYLDREVLHREAIRWALAAGGRNGRTAEQFVRSLP